MEVLHISFSRSGGAGQVAVALNKALQELGHKSDLKTVSDVNLWESPLAHPLLTFLAAIDRFVVQSTHSPTLFSAFRARMSSSRLERAVIASTAQIIHLHWVSGVLSKEAILRIHESGKKIVWTLHDTAPFTGGCHQNFDCVGFQADCKNCPQVKPFFKGIPTKNFQTSKANRIGNTSTVYVAPSKWLAEKAASSSLLRSSHIEVVPNPVREEFYVEASNSGFPTFLNGLHNLTLLVANDLTDPNKNVKQLVEIVKNFNLVTNNKMNLILVGRGGTELHSPSRGVYNLGVKNNAELAEIMRSVKINLMVSSAESFSLTTAEALASGSFPIVRRGTAAAELIEEGITGSTFDSFEELLDKWIQIAEILSLNKTHRPPVPAEQFRPINVARRYLGLYGDLIGK